MHVPPVVSACGSAALLVPVLSAAPITALPVAPAKAGDARLSSATSTRTARGPLEPVPASAKLHCAPVVVPHLPDTAILGARVFSLTRGQVGFLCSEEAYKSDAVSETKRTHALVSLDAGVSWSAYTGDAGRWTHAPKLSGGALLEVGSYGWENHPDTPEERSRLAAAGLYVFDAQQGNAPGTISVIHRLWQRRSGDSGRTWSPKAEIPLRHPMPHLAVYGRAIVLRDGTYLAPMWGRFDLGQEPKFVSALVLRSTDRGRTWALVRVARSVTQDFNEHEIAQAPNGDVVSVIRTTRQRDLWQATSRDGGRTWTDLHPSGMLGSTPALTRSRRALVCIYSRRSLGVTPTTGICAGISRDNGRTWRSYALWDAKGAVVDGYPVALALPGGRVCASFGAQVDGRLSGWVVTFDPADM